MNIGRFSWGHRKAILFVAGILCLVGGYFSTHLPVAIFPNLTVPRVIVTASAGDTPIPVMLANVTRPLENAVASVPSITRIRSMTVRGNAELDVSFSWGTNMLVTLQKVQARITQIQNNLPPGTQVLSERLNPSIFPVMGYSLYSDTLSPETLRTIALYTLRPRLLRVRGVREISVLGGDTPDYVVQLDPKSLLQHGVTATDVEDALARDNEVASVGYYNQSYLHYQIMVNGLLHGVSDIENVTVSVKNRIPITIGDLGSVTRSVEKRTIETSGNGRDAVLINVVKQPDANTVAVARGINETLDAIKPGLPRGITFSVFYDQSQIVEESRGSVVEAIVVGGTLALIVLMLFLGNLRTAFVVLIILPLTILITFALMKALGQTINIMTLGAMAIALGLVTDDGIVVVENIYKEMEHGRPFREAIYVGVRDITPAMIGSSLATIAAFLPLTFLSGVTGQFIGPMAIVMIATLGVSLALSLFLIPIMAHYFLPREAAGPGPGSPKAVIFFQRFFARVTEWYGIAFNACLAVGKRTPLFLAVLGCISFLAFTHLKTGFFPEFDEGGFVLDYRMPSGTSLEQTSAVCKDIESNLAQTPEVAAWSRRTGAQLGFDITTQNTGDFSVRLKSSRHKNIYAVMDELRQRINETIPSVKIDFGQILQDNIGDIAGTPRPIEIKIFGPNMNVLERLARKTAAVISKIRGVVDVNDGIVGSGPEVDLRVNTASARRYGLSTDDVRQAAAAAVLGVEPTYIQEGDQPVGVRVVLGHGARSFDPYTLPSVLVASPVTGGVVPLSSVADIHVREGLPKITRENQQQMLPVTASLSGRDLGSAINKVKQEMNKQVMLPSGYHVEYGGLYESQQESFRQLTLVLFMAALFVFTLLLFQFRSFKQSFALFIAAIFSLLGVFLGLLVTGTPLNISSFTGAIMIVGIVTENGIVLFDFYNQLRKKSADADPRRLMLEAGKNRLRPILMTTLAAILALFPLSLGIGAGAAMQKPLAVAVIGGLLVSTFFTLILAPVFLLALDELAFSRFVAGNGKVAEHVLAATETGKSASQRE